MVVAHEGAFPPDMEDVKETQVIRYSHCKKHTTTADVFVSLFVHACVFQLYRYKPHLCDHIRMVYLVGDSLVKEPNAD